MILGFSLITSEISFSSCICVCCDHDPFLALLWQLASGEVFGPNQPIALKLLGSERSFQALEGMLLSKDYFLLFPLSSMPMIYAI